MLCFEVGSCRAEAWRLNHSHDSFWSCTSCQGRQLLFHLHWVYVMSPMNKGYLSVTELEKQNPVKCCRLSGKLFFLNAPMDAYVFVASLQQWGKDARVCNMIGCLGSLPACVYKTPRCSSVRQSAVRTGTLALSGTPWTHWELSLLEPTKEIVIIQKSSNQLVELLEYRSENFGPDLTTTPRSGELKRLRPWFNWMSDLIVDKE